MHELWRRPLLVAASVLMVIGMIVPTAMASGLRGVAHRPAAASGTIIFSDNQFPDTLNPFEAGAAVDIESTYLTMPSGYALFYNGKAKLVPGMLTKVPTLKNGGISKDGKTITVFLRHGLKWSNGQPITSQDMKFAWQLGLDPQLGTCASSCDHIKSMSLPNKYEAIWHMKDVYSAAIPNAYPGLMPHGWSKLSGGVHAAAGVLSDVNFTYEDSSYVTAGPYKISQFVTNNRIVLTPNSKFNVKALGGKPRVSKYIFLFYPDVDTEIAGAIKHETDVTTDYTLAQYPQLQAHKKQFKTLYASTLSPEHMEFNMLDKTVNDQPNPLVNLKVRQAISLAVDRFGIQKSVFGISNKGVAANLFTYDAPFVSTPSVKQPFSDPKINGIWDPIIKKYIPYGAQSIKDAKTLLKGTPCAKGCSVQISSTTLPQRAAEAAVVEKNLAKIGITSTFTPIKSTIYFATYQKGGTLSTGKFELGIFAYVGVAPDPDSWKFNMESKFINRLDPNHSILDSNNAGLRDPIVNKAFEKAASSFNPSVRRQNYYIAQEEISKQVPWIDLSIRPDFCTYDSKVTGLSNNGYAVACQWNAYGWKAR